MHEPPASTPEKAEQPRRPRGKAAAFLPIVIILGAFFLIVFVVAVLMLPDHGKKLLKLTESNPVMQIHHAAITPRDC